MSISPPQTSRRTRAPYRRARQPRKAALPVAGRLAQLVLIAAVTVAPWLFGGVQAAVQVWLLCGAVVALGCWLLQRLTDRSASAVLPVAVVPLVCAAALGVFQIVPLSAKVHEILSPGGAELGRVLQDENPSSPTSLEENLGMVATAGQRPLSLYPASTRRDLALLTLATGVFLCGAVFFKNPRAQIWLCGLIAINGAALALFGMVQQLTFNGMLYWSVPLTNGGGPFGPFVNHNNAGGFLNLCLAGALGMTVWAMTRHRTHDSGTHSSGADTPRTDHWGVARTRPARGRGLLAKLSQQALDSFAHLDALALFALTLTVFIVAGIVCSLSRGAWIAMFAAAIVTALAVWSARRGHLKLWWMALAATAGLALVSWVGMSGQVRARLATLADQQTIAQARIPHWRDGLRAMPDFWQTGSGLGTYRYVYGLYQQRFDDAWYYHAENQYLETLVEGGIVGLGLMLTLIGLVFLAAWRLMRDDSDSRAPAIGVAGIFAVSSQATHALFDFGLYIPANMILCALVCGSISGRVAHLARQGSSPRVFALPPVRPLATALAALLLVAAVWACLEIRSVAAIETAMKNTRVSQTPDGPAPEVLLRATQRMAVALQHREDDAEAQYRMARLWVGLYRARALEQLRRENAPAADDLQLWQLTAPVALHASVHRLARDRRTSELNGLRGEPVIGNHLPHALKHLILARRSCALLPGVHLMLAELSVLLDDPSDDSIHLERLRRLAPSDPDVLFRAGLLDMNAGRNDLAYDSWRRSLSLSPRYLDGILHFVGQWPIGPRTIERLLPDSPSLLIKLARERYRSDENAAIRRMFAQRAAELLKQDNCPEDEHCYLAGAALALQGQYAQAIADYTRAVRLRPRQTGWRYELALALKQQGMIAEAHEHAALCARMKPNQRQYRDLLEEINHTRLTSDPSSGPLK
ncbi:MAG: hypothetical protein A2V70_08400 [Planctomycetes bacterium RBG_13_63_9]|nr:MAG: hypothetical protein A2V70_08400 [Planctomycetes bacterium RBG_13_63_9]